MKKIVGSLLLIFLLLLACDSKDKIKFSKVRLKKQVSVFSDSSFFGRVSDVILNNEHLLITDLTQNRILLCDTSFNKAVSYGGTGEGPGEFKEVLRSYIKNNLVFLFDRYNGALSVFSLSGKFVKRITYPRRIASFGRFAMDDSLKIYIADPDRDSSVVKLDTSGQIVRQFGSVFPGKNFREKRARSEKHILWSKDNQLICISLSEPHIEFYSTNGKKLQEFSLADSPYLTERLAYVKEQYQQEPKKRESTYLLFQDAYLVNNHLYLLYVDQDEQNRPKLDKILVYTVESNNLRFYKAIDLSNDRKGLWYDVIAVTSDEKMIYAFAGNLNEWRIFSIQ